MSPYVAFFLGLVAGACLGVLVMGLLTMASEDGH